MNQQQDQFLFQPPSELPLKFAPIQYPPGDNRSRVDTLELVYIDDTDPRQTNKEELKKILLLQEQKEKENQIKK